MAGMELNNRDQIIWYCLYVPACVSLVSSLWVLLSYGMFRKLQTPTMRLVMLQAVTHVLLSLCNNVAFYKVPSTGTMACNFQGWSLSFCFVCTVFAAAAISVYMLLTIERKRRISLSWKRLVVLAAGIVVFSAALAAAPFITDQFGYIGSRCWIQESGDNERRQNGTILRFAGYFAVVWLCNIIIVWSYYRVIRYVRYLDRNNILSVRAQFIHRTVNVLLMYPVISIVVWTPITVIRVITAVDRTYIPSTPFLGACMVLVAGQGFFFALVFARYRVVQEGWGRLFRSLLAAFCRLGPCQQYCSCLTPAQPPTAEETEDNCQGDGLQIVQIGGSGVPATSGGKRRNKTTTARKQTAGGRSNPMRSGNPDEAGASNIKIEGDVGRDSLVGPSLSHRIFSTFADMDLQLPDDDANYDGDEEQSANARDFDSDRDYEDDDDYDDCNAATYVDEDFENPARPHRGSASQYRPTVSAGPAESGAPPVVLIYDPPPPPLNSATCPPNLVVDTAPVVSSTSSYKPQTDGSSTSLV